MSWMGIAMFGVLCILILTTGLPVWALLLGVSSLFALLAVASGHATLSAYAVLGERMVGLLADDLLQAIPIFVLIGTLLYKLPIADAVFDLLYRFVFRRARPSVRQSLSCMTLGALVAPMNGSAASSASLLGRLLAGRLRHQDPARAITLLSAAATIGVVVPPSLVLLLLGDAMMRAHLEASRLPGYAMEGLRIINTQDVLRAALIPAVVIVLLWLVVAAWQARGDVSAEPEVQSPLEPMPWSRRLLALASVTILLGLLVGVFMGWMLPVEAAATGGTLMITATLLSRSLSWSQWKTTLMESLQLSGALFALLVGATTFSLAFRSFGTDRWMSETLINLPMSFWVAALVILLVVALCALVLDAFEMIFVVVPIVAPVLIVFMGDPRQAAVLLLFVLQLSFLLPPMGYAYLMIRANAGLAAPPMRRLLRTMAPYAIVQMAVMVAVFSWPALTNALAGSNAYLTPTADLNLNQAIETMQNLGGRDWDDEE
jgi:TRAP-type mannitol/chloroaromatic compound transport system permease large subunit